MDEKEVAQDEEDHLEDKDQKEVVKEKDVHLVTETSALQEQNDKKEEHTAIGQILQEADLIAQDVMQRGPTELLEIVLVDTMLMLCANKDM